MRIAFVTPEYVTELDYDGGLANYLHRACLSLVDMGHEPIVIVASERNEKIVRDRIEVYRVVVRNPWIERVNRLTRGRFQIGLNWLWQSWKLNQTLAKIHALSPVSIVQHTSYTATGIFRLKKVPSVVRISSYHPLLIEAYDVERSLDQRIAEKLEGIAFAKADGLFGPSQVIGEIVGEAVGKKVEIIESPFTLDVTETDDKPFLDLLKGKKYLLFFGTVGLLKGVKTIADIIEELLGKHKDLYFVLVGKDAGYKNGSMMDYVWKNAGSHKSRVLYMGKMPHNQLYPILSNALAVVLPSRIDNFPNTCLEAMAHKRVVIGTRGTSFEQLIDDGTSGFLCEKDNPRDLLETIEKVVSLDNGQRNKIGESAFQRILQLTPENAVGQLIAYYQWILTRI